MKKIAFYVEGQTEQFFINKLLIEIAGRKNIQIELQQFQGIGKPTKAIYPRNLPVNPTHHALILDCVGDGENTCIIVAVDEIEAWFLAECLHFECIHSTLTNVFIVNNMELNPCIDDMTLITNPAKTLNDIYKLVGKTYNKKKSQIDRTVKCLDYANLYLNVKDNVLKLNDLISKIDNFLT